MKRLAVVEAVQARRDGDRALSGGIVGAAVDRLDSPGRELAERAVVLEQIPVFVAASLDPGRGPDAEAAAGQEARGRRGRERFVEAQLEVLVRRDRYRLGGTVPEDVGEQSVTPRRTV